MHIDASVNYHVKKSVPQAFEFDVDGIVGNLVSPELVPTDIKVADIRHSDFQPSLAQDGMLYIGVGNGSPWNRAYRSPGEDGTGEGDNLYLSSIVAIRPDTGEYVWHYQTTPGETWDYTATQHIILADMASVPPADSSLLGIANWIEFEASLPASDASRNVRTSLR